MTSPYKRSLSPVLAALIAGVCMLSSRIAAYGDPVDPWWKHAVVYEIYPRSFQDSKGNGIGDLNGITARLDYLQALGVDALWIAPMYPSPQVDFGYDVSDYESVDPQYGTLADFDRLVAEAKKRDIRIVLDMVVNHTSDKHEWFVESSRSRTDPKHDWYCWSDGKTEDPTGYPFLPTTGSVSLGDPPGNSSLRSGNSITTSSIGSSPTSTGGIPPWRRQSSTR